MQYTIQQINENGSIDVSFDIDGVSQNLSGVPLDSIDALNQFLYDYGTAYEAGINLTQTPIVDTAVTALVGQSVDLVIDKSGAITSSISVTPIGVKGGLNA